MRQLKTGLAVIGAAAILVLAANTVALAATGQALLLGKSNSSSNITAVTRTTSGSVLKLNSLSAANAPLSVTGKGKVINLNADTVDGFSSADLRDRTYVYTSVFQDKSSVTYLLPVPNGSYLVTYSASFPAIGNAAVQCFVSEQPTSGENGTTTGHEAQNYVAGTGSGPALNGAAHATRSADQNILVGCSSEGDTWSVNENNPLTITATPTALVTESTLAPLG